MIRDRIEPETQRFRAATGGRIDRSRTIRFRFDGRTLTGHPGDTLASALLANGMHLVGRSFKYHRPRGILSAGSEEPNALVTVRRDWRRTTPNLRATDVELYEGLDAVSQNRWPSLTNDVSSVNDRLSPFFPAGFYYKTFMGPRRFGLGSNGAWTKLYEPVIRRMAGLGCAPIAADPDRYASRYAHCDVLVVGAGPAGLGAALAAAEAGSRVIIADEQAEPGGTLLAAPGETIEGAPAWDWLADALGRVAAHDRITLLPRTTVFGAYPDRMFGLAERISDHLADPDPALPRERLWQVRAKAIVLATGAIERPLVFPSNDRPGIMLAGAVSTYLHRYGVLAGSRVVVATEDDSGYRVAADLADHGVRVERIVDRRTNPCEAAQASAERAGIEVSRDAALRDTWGRLRVAGVEMSTATGKRERIKADLVLMAGGWQPTLHLFAQLRGRLVWSEATDTLAPAAPIEGVHLAGASAGGAASMEAAVAAGRIAGDAAANDAAGRVIARLAPSSLPAPLPNSRRIMAAATRGRAFVDFQNDVTAKDLALATREGFRSIEHVKRYTTSGMATDQGKTSGLNTVALVAENLGAAPSRVGHTTYRPPFTPVTFGTIAAECRGELFDPVRRTPIDAEARTEGAIFEDVGQWQRARFFLRAGEDMAAAVSRECKTVREAVGLFDASTLGKIEVTGPGAAAFLDRMYVNALGKLAVGRARYALMLNEAGFVIDDGIVARLAEDRFHVTTTTGGAARVLAHMEDYRQTEFPDLTCWLTSVTEQWGVIAVQGPKSREALAGLTEDLDLSAGGLPHMGVAEGRILGVPMRLMRVSFTGELGFEINVPAGYARPVWQVLRKRVAELGGAPYGTEAMHVLRAEKGFIIVGQETDGTVTPADIGMASGDSKRDFVGKRGLARPDLRASDRPELVGLEIADGGGRLEEGAQLTEAAVPPAGTPALGHVTSSYWSAVLGRPIALAMVKGGRARMGDELFVPMPGGSRRVRVADPVFFDPLGQRLHG